MSVSYTFATLKTALSDWLEDDFSDYVDELPDIIGKAELRCLRDLGLELFDRTNSSEMTIAGTSTINLPTGAIMLRSLYVNHQFVEPRSEAYVRYYQQHVSPTQGQPLYWCQHTTTTILMTPTPDAVYTTRQRTLHRPTGLSDANPTTFLSTAAGDLLFWAAVTLSERFDKAPEDADAAEAEYQKLLPLAQEELRHLARVDYA